MQSAVLKGKIPSLTSTRPFSPAPKSPPPPSLFYKFSRGERESDRTCRSSQGSWRTRAMRSTEKSDSLRNFKLSESSFLASLMPKKEIGADRFIEANPEHDGRGVIIAIFDSGVDPAAAGLQVTSDGKPKVLDVLDCTGSGDVETSTVVKADADGHIHGASGATLVVNSSWKNPSGEWHVGYKLVYELFTNTLTSRLKEERKKKWDEKNQGAIAEALMNLDEFDQKHVKVEDPKLKRIREDLQNRIDFLRKEADSYDDKGPVIDVVVWNDGEFWRVALDTQNIEDEPGRGKLADFAPLTNYRIERKFGVFSKLYACTFVTNVYEDGNIVSIVTDCSSHGTHVAGIATAFHPQEPLLNGVAPGAQIISCKIGDTRLGSMETGTGLIRALIAAVEHKCDLINMSYGEPTLLPDYGRFIDLINEVVNKHRLIFVSSAGNNGPALSTVGAPGGTTSSIIGVGAYVSPMMAAGAHCLVEPPDEGLQYTWSSRGPTADGDLGVSISAPGGAVAPVPTWMLQCRKLMNGTSMASPSACGGVALILSAMKAEGIPVSPYSVRRALENTATPIGSLPEDKLTAGMGLMQVDKALEYIRQSRDTPCVWYDVKVNLSGKATPTFRGIYLREASACQQPTEWTVQVQPKFHEDASNLDQLVPFEECIELHSSDKTVIRPPEYLLLTHNGRTFNIIVDPTKLKDGLHYHEVYGVDCKAPWRGPLFRIPVTITKPVPVKNQPPVASFSGMQFSAGHIERRYIEVPRGTTWVEATMRVSGFETSRMFYVDALQLSPLKRPMKWESVVTFSFASVKTFAFQVEGGQTMELAIAQFWSSGRGSQETTTVDFEVEFHGISVNNEEIIFDGSDAPVRIDVGSLLSSEKLVPSAVLRKVRVPQRPFESKLRTLSTNRDRLPSGKQILGLTLTYKIKLEESAEITPHLPLLNNRIYDTKFESQFYMISDSNKRVHSLGDVYPNSTKLPKGEYTLMLYLRHDDVQLLEKMKSMVLFIERTLEDKEVIRLSFFSQPDGPTTGNSSYKQSVLIPGLKEAFYVAPPNKDKLPKNCSEGTVLVGEISYGKLSSMEQGDGKDHPASYQICYVVPPNKLDHDKEKGSPVASTKSLADRLEEEVRDAKIKFLTSLRQNNNEERLEWEKLSVSLKTEYAKHTPLLAKILDGLLSRNKLEDKASYYKQVINAANEVVDSVDRDELAKYLSQKSDPEDDEAEKIKKQKETTRDQLADALYQKGLALAELESLKGEREAAESSKEEGAVDAHLKDNLFEENYKELRKWIDVKSSKYGMLSVIRERRSGRLGTALKVLNGIIQDDGDSPKKKLYELKLSLIDEIGWAHVASYERQWMHVRFPASLPLF
ncbi:tripeptidyl-peptidase II Tpp2 [Ancistrocladus abbreviatus]